ncbi:MAG: hypothetical protein ACLP7Q_22995, partial [Isosphaeraceae bacterium]
MTATETETAAESLLSMAVCRTSNRGKSRIESSPSPSPEGVLESVPADGVRAGDLVHKYEAERYPIEAVADRDIVRCLLESNGMDQIEL